ncbi:Predicted RNA-binding protein, associated with RNAse of E/G family [Nocardioides exalbidus]|uniref:Predicted RNA-binding protein, associated with RNAse of E/G family n=1 Tax=Nocardioides exalbidus TaxID=402596 RepID=A0A1H4LWP1_9ACTN|nr:DUF402 domain-containing protein [Nocardioides exalbidus]SEB74695.1 Predicted RNA-binding protein, associated with RNAse of E/G family [Nocardioides exalbidus]
MADGAFPIGSDVRVVEVLHGAEWASWDEEVVADDGILVTLQRNGTPLTFPPHDHPHPWAHVDAWTGTTVLKLRREGDWYSVWKFFDADGAFLHWYVNFETPYVRADGAIHVNDLQLDIVVPPDGDWRWKDVQDLAPTLASGRITQDELLAVLREAAHVAELLDRGDLWWAPWDGWTPADGMI